MRSGSNVSWQRTNSPVTKHTNSCSAWKPLKNKSKTSPTQKPPVCTSYAPPDRAPPLLLQRRGNHHANPSPKTKPSCSTAVVENTTQTSISSRKQSVATAPKWATSLLHVTRSKGQPKPSLLTSSLNKMLMPQTNIPYRSTAPLPLTASMIESRLTPLLQVEAGSCPLDPS